jgi:hypothetical protein
MFLSLSLCLSRNCVFHFLSLSLIVVCHDTQLTKTTTCSTGWELFVMLDLPTTGSGLTGRMSPFPSGIRLEPEKIVRASMDPRLTCGQTPIASWTSTLSVNIVLLHVVNRKDQLTLQFLLDPLTLDQSSSTDVLLATSSVVLRLEHALTPDSFLTFLLSASISSVGLLPRSPMEYSSWLTTQGRTPR